MAIFHHFFFPCSFRPFLFHFSFLQSQIIYFLLYFSFLLIWSDFWFHCVDKKKVEKKNFFFVLFFVLSFIYLFCFILSFLNLFLLNSSNFFQFFYKTWICFISINLLFFDCFSLLCLKKNFRKKRKRKERKKGKGKGKKKKILLKQRPP